MIIEEREAITIQAGDVLPGAMVEYNSEYWIRADGMDEYNDPMFINLRSGEVKYPDEFMLCFPHPDAKVVV